MAASSWSVLLVHSHSDVGALFVDGRDDGAGVGVETVFALGVTYAADGPAGDILDIDVCVVGGDFASDDYESGADEGLAGNAGVGVLAEEVIEDGVGNLIRDLVGMPFRN